MSSKPSSPSKERNSRVLRGYCGAREFVTPTHFTLGPKACAEDMQRKSKWPRNAAENNPVLGIPKPRREEWHAIKGSPQSAPRKKDEYSRTHTGVQCGSGSRKNCHLCIECDNKRPGDINGKRPLNSVVSVIATNKKWGEAADGTSTRVATCLINRWKVRIN